MIDFKAQTEHDIKLLIRAALIAAGIIGAIVAISIVRHLLGG